MDPHELEEFKALLEERLQELEARAASTRQDTDTVELDQPSVGRLSRMDALQGQQMALAAERRRQEGIQRVKGALRRLEKGDFGDCAVCGEPIAPARLKFDPTCTRCIECA